MNWELWLPAITSVVGQLIVGGYFIGKLQTTIRALEASAQKHEKMFDLLDDDLERKLASKADDKDLQNAIIVWDKDVSRLRHDHKDLDMRVRIVEVKTGGRPDR